MSSGAAPSNGPAAGGTSAGSAGGAVAGSGVFQRSSSAAQRLLGQLFPLQGAVRAGCAPLTNCLTSATQTGHEEALEEARAEILALRRERARWEMESKAMDALRHKHEAEIHTLKDQLAASQGKNSLLQAEVKRLNADLVRVVLRAYPVTKHLWDPCSLAAFHIPSKCTALTRLFIIVRRRRLGRSRLR